MSYEIPRPAKTLVELEGKVLGKDETKKYQAGKAVKVQRDPTNPGQFVIYFEYNRGKGVAVFKKIPGSDLNTTVEYTDGRNTY